MASDCHNVTVSEPQVTCRSQSGAHMDSWTPICRFQDGLNKTLRIRFGTGSAMSEVLPRPSAATARSDRLWARKTAQSPPGPWVSSPAPRVEHRYGASSLIAADPAMGWGSLSEGYGPEPATVRMGTTSGVHPVRIGYDIGGSPAGHRLSGCPGCREWPPRCGAVRVALQRR